MTESLFFPKNIKPICEICISTPIHIDQNLFKYWLKGESISEISKRKLEEQKDLYQKYIQYVVSSQKVSIEVAEKQLEFFVENQLQNTFRNFSLLSRFLSCPEMLRNQMVFSINQKDCAELINQYYEVDGAVLKELVVSNRFKQLKNRKKTLAGERKGKPSIVSKRVESNFERVYKFAIGLTDGSVTESIQNEFLFPSELAQKYERILFLSYHKFDLKVQFAKSINYDSMARAMLSWCRDNKKGYDDRFRIDEIFSKKLKSIKNLFQTKDTVDEFKRLIINFDPNPLPPEKRKYEKEIPKLIPAIVNIGANLDQPREFKDFFVDIYEKILAPLKERDLTQKEVEVFFSKVKLTFPELLNSLNLSEKSKEKYSSTWKRYISGLERCLVSIYGKIR